MSTRFRDAIDRDALLARASHLIATPTTNPPGDEATLAESLAAECRALGFETTVVPLAERRASVAARLRGRGNRPAVVLSGHLDTVPPGQSGWTRDPFRPEIVDGRLYGLGACDMKGAVAAIVEAAATIVRQGIELQGDLVLAFSANEETNSSGAATLVDAGTLGGVGAVLIAEPTGNNVVIAEKGVAWLEVTTRGQTAHGSMPERGVNAIYHMAAILAEVERLTFDLPPHPLLGRPSVNVGRVGGGVAPNVVADRCTATLDIRLIPGQHPDDAMAAVQAILDRVGRQRDRFSGEAQLFLARVPVDTDPAHRFVRLALEVASAVEGRRQTAGGVTYATDGSVFVPALNAALVICGPGEAAMAHQPNEWVEVAALVRSVEIYAECVTRWLAG